MGETYFVLMERGFSYNDETYIPCEGGNPSKIFSSKEDALKAAEKKNIETFVQMIKDGSIREYGYCLFDVVDSSKTSKLGKRGIFYKLFGMTAEDWWDSTEFLGFENDPTDEQLAELISCFNFDFYEIVEVQKD